MPAGWGYEMQPGSGGLVGVPLDEQSPKAIGHWSNGQGRFIDVFEKGEYYVLANDASRTKLFADAVNARTGAVHEGFAAEFKIGRCHYSLIAFGLAWESFQDVLAGLMLIDGGVGHEDGYAVWPRLTPRDDLSACRKFPSWRNGPFQVARRFMNTELGTTGSLHVVDEGTTVTTLKVIDPIGREVAHVRLEDVALDCWAVTHVSSGQQGVPGVHSLSFRKDRVSVVFNTRSTVPTVQMHWSFEELRNEAKLLTDVRDSRVYEMRMGYDPDTQGRVLILFINEDGELIGAFGMPLPARDFAAG